MNKNNRLFKLIILISLVVILSILPSCDLIDLNVTQAPLPVPGDDLIVHFIDVGQGDSILIQFPEGETLLIDASTRSRGNDVVSYLKNNGISAIDYLVATHPHEDHIGGLTKVIDEFDIGKIYMPKVAHTTKTYEDLLTVIKEKNLKVTTAKVGVTIFENPEINVKILAPASDKYKEINDYSAVIKIKYNQTSFLFMGDAMAASEKELLSEDISANLIKIGHHGSNSSTNNKFLEKVNPEYAVISCGTDNSYGHPAENILKKLAENDIDTYRTDKSGTIIAASDGTDITISKER